MQIDPRFLLLVAIVIAAWVLLFGASRRFGGMIRRGCRNCGTQHPSFARFCRKCGNRL